MTGRQVFGGLLGDLPIVVEEQWLRDKPEQCDPRESAQVSNALPVRRIEHAAGRTCARRALGRLGIYDFVLLNGSDRCPMWPADIVGSITHTGRSPLGYCAVAVAQTAEVMALGIDAERADSLEPALWDMIATPAERGVLARMGNDAGWYAKLLFTAKESFYKAQYPITRRLLDFQDVEIDLDIKGRRFTAALATTKADIALPFAHATGRFIVDGTNVLSSVVVLKSIEAHLADREQ